MDDVAAPHDPPAVRASGKVRVGTGAHNSGTATAARTDACAATTARTVEAARQQHASAPG
jgi:hypothetical protein